jgi:hypothetical protein
MTPEYILLGLGLCFVLLCIVALLWADGYLGGDED